MNKIITIGREFGSGGRELGRRLAEELKIEYYDREILSQIAERTSFTEQYIREVEARLPHPLHPITIGRSFFLPENQNLQQAQTIFREQSQILRELAENRTASSSGGAPITFCGTVNLSASSSTRTWKARSAAAGNGAGTMPV